MIGTERVAPLVASGVENLAVAEVPWVRLLQARDDALGAPESAPFDRILVSAMAPRLPRELIAQLTPGGVMVTPARGRMLRIVRGQPPLAGPDDAVVTDHGGYRFVPLMVP